MALRAIRGLMKFDNFMTDLGLTYYQAIGILESIWHFTATNAIQGNVGKHTNQEIAKWIGYAGDPDKLISVLTHRRWLDRHSEHRLIVHDWHLHADKSVKVTLKNRNLCFCMPEELTGIPKEIIGNPSLKTGSLSGSGADPDPDPDLGAGAVETAAVKRHNPVEILKPFPETARQPALQSAIVYQTRRYGGPMPSATWYPSLLNEAGTLFEVQEDPAKALEVFTEACKSPPTRTLPRDATYSQIAEHCGLKKSRFSVSPWEANKQKNEDDGRKRMHEAIRNLGLPKG